MGMVINIEYTPEWRALKPPDYKTLWLRKDNIFISIYQTIKGEEVHMICFNTTSSMKRAERWGKLKSRQLRWNFFREFGLMTYLKMNFF